MQTTLAQLAHSPIYAKMGARLLGAHAWTAIYLDRNCSFSLDEIYQFSIPSMNMTWRFFIIFSFCFLFKLYFLLSDFRFSSSLISI